MRLLLDTNALLWWMTDDRQLGQAARLMIADNAVLFSSVSLWEIAVKTSIGKLNADVETVASTARRQGFVQLGIELPHIVRVATLPRHHKDPFDHLLIAQAIVEGATLVTTDPWMRRYPVEVVDC